MPKLDDAGTGRTTSPRADVNAARTLAFELERDDVRAYLRERNVVPKDADIAMESLSNGVSNVVLRASWSGGCVVLKQSLSRLRVAAEWNFDRARIFNERDCLQVLNELRPGTAPKVLLSDEENFLFGMSCAPPEGYVWKEAKLRGDTDPTTARRAGRIIGELQRAAAHRGDLARRFAALWPLEQGRVEPYHRTVARAHPDLAPRIEAEVQRMMATRETLVHGDFSPKNVIVYPNGLLVLDCEVAHWGDPAFDPAFLLTHLVLAGVHRPDLAATFAQHAAGFWKAYVSEAREFAAPERNVIAELGCLLLARVDGKSPVEYLTEARQHEHVRRLARRLITDAPEDLASVLTFATTESERWLA